MDRWDFIIIGAGSAGCVLANRLSADPSINVLLLEAGVPDRSPYIHVPAALVKAVGNPALDWCHMAEPDPTRYDKVDLWPAGKTLGGSSSINGMLFVRGAREDFDGWAAAGCRGWSYDDVLPLFKRMERTEFGDAQLRGREGPMHVSRLRTTHPLGPVFLAAARECGYAINADYNGVSQEGAAEPQVTQRTGWRWSSARAFLAPARHRANLRVLTSALVESLVFERDRCVGARVRRRDSSVATYRADGEVILCAGTIGSPKLLMLSGVGAGETLQKVGIATRLECAAVGANLQEHPNSVVCAAVNVRTYNMEINSPRIVGHLITWLLAGRGPATSPYPHAVAFLRSRPEEPRPDLQFLFGPFAFAFDERGIVPYRKPAVSIVVNACHPVSRGRVQLRSSDPTASPRIEHRLLESAEDLRRQVAGCRIARQLLAARAFAPFQAREYLPGPAVQNEAEWIEHLRRTTFLGYHPVGTCRMGADADAVVDPELRVRGVQGLRVADASIMPTLIAANTNAAALMIGEKASDLILAAQRFSRAA